MLLAQLAELTIKLANAVRPSVCLDVNRSGIYHNRCSQRLTV